MAVQVILHKSTNRSLRRLSTSFDVVGESFQEPVEDRTSDTFILALQSVKLGSTVYSDCMRRCSVSTTQVITCYMKGKMTPSSRNTEIFNSYLCEFIMHIRVRRDCGCRNVAQDQSQWV
jgi:hypothetical protein